MTHSETKGIVMTIFFLDTQSTVFQQGHKSMLAGANILEAAFLHDYIISFDILVSLPPLVLFQIACPYQYFLFYPPVSW
jgi:hypothetical protein